MRKILLVLFVALGVAVTSCMEDKGNYDYTQLNEITIKEIGTAYERQVTGDRLTIRPVVEGDGEYDYCWTAVLNKAILGQVAKPDTLAMTKDLDLELNYKLGVGQWLLIFTVRDRATDVTAYTSTTLDIITETMHGWYFGKQAGDHAEMDFFGYNGAVTRDWIASFNDGYRVEGNFLKMILLNQYKDRPTDANMQMGLMMVTDDDMAVFRAQDGQLSRTFDDGLFFIPPASRNIVAAAGGNQSYQAVSVLIDGEIYTMSVTALGGSMIATPPPAAGNKVTHVVGGFMTMIFDTASNSFKTFNGNAFGLYAERDTDANPAPVSCNNMDVEPLWIEAAYVAARARTLMQGVDDPSRFFVATMDTSWMYYYPSRNPIIGWLELSAGAKLPLADAKGMHLDTPFIYFAVGGDVYKFDCNTAAETLMFSLPAGETVTMLQHVKYDPSALNKFVIASTDGGNYKVWMADMPSTGDFTLPAAPAYEGTGVVKCVNYIENSNGTNVSF